MPRRIDDPWRKLRDGKAFSKSAKALLDLPGKSRERLCGFGLEAAWACVTQGGMSPGGIIEAVDVSANGDGGLVSGADGSK